MRRTLAYTIAATAVLGACKNEPAEIRVKGPRDAVESVRANPEFAPFEKQGESIQLRASAFDDKGTFMGPANVRWDSSDRTVATVSQTGLVTILSSGQTEISATTVGYEKALTSSMPVRAVIVKDIRITDPEPKEAQSVPIALGETKQFKAEVLNDRGEPIEDAKVQWESTSFATTVTPTGEVEGRAIGTTQIIAEAKNGKTARVDVEVTDWKKPRRKRRR